MEAIKCPFIVLVDSREQLNYTFKGLRADANKQFRPLQVDWEWATLASGDYSIQGFGDIVCIERKTLVDLYGSCGANRERFEREHQRMSDMEFAAVVIEADMRMMIKQPPKHTKLSPKCVYRTMLSWMVRYKVPWILAGAYTPKRSRRLAEITTFRLLEKFWNEQQK